MADATGEHPVVLFDGVCNFCSDSVNFIIDRDPRGTFRFAPAAIGGGAHDIRGGRADHPARGPESMAVFDRGRLLERSSAILRIVRDLRGAWPLLSALRARSPPAARRRVPVVAARRYRWFGKSATCRVPSPEIRARFLA